MFGCWVGCFPIPKVTHKGSGEGGAVDNWWVQQFCDILGKKGGARHMILGNNPARHGFVLRDLVLIELFQRNHNFVTECTLQAKFLLKLIWKLLEIPFFPICGISQDVIFLSNRRRKFKLLDLQRHPPPTQTIGLGLGTKSSL